MRTLLKQPGFTLIAVLTLALGICGVTTQFSIVDAALLRGLPFPEPDRLVRITMRDPSWAPDRDRNPWLSDVIEFGKETRSFDGLAGYSYAAPVIANISGMPQRLSGCHVTSNFFALLGVRPALGQCARIVPTTAPTRRRILLLVLRQGGVQFILGTVFGMVLTLLLLRLGKSVVSNFLYQVNPHDPVVYAGVIGLLAAATVLACLAPARRATKVDPLVALRYE